MTLQQRNNRDARAWRILATRQADTDGGLVRISLRSAVPRRSLAVFGTRVRSSRTVNTTGRITSFAADPALRASSGFSGAGGATPGVVAMNRAATDATSTGNGSSAAREVAESDIWRVEGDRLYFFNQLRGLQVFDIANPDAPVLLGQLREPNRGEQMYLLGTDHVALLTRPSYFFSLANRPFSLARKGAAAYDAGSGSAVIADVADGAPREIARVPYEGYLAESRLVGSILYLVSQVFDPAEGSRLRVTSVDLSDPAFPTQADSLELEGYAGTVTATDRFLFVASP
ncbi:MAG: beta-propeller domain-containing protein, partial [Verrucomicrobia bacterium]|nr:beta-propeller domain-containing protein [Verrucomicrobiota bacterium]